MSSPTQSEDSSKGADARQINEAAEEVDALLAWMDEERPEPPAHRKRKVAVAIKQLRNKLHSYRNEDALDTEWDERDIDLSLVDRLLSETTTVREPVAYRRNAYRETEAPIIEFTDPEVLEALALELKDIKHELGFHSETDSGTHRTEIDDELLEEVEQWRKQTLE